MKETTIAVGGMTCTGCVNSVTMALRAVPGVAKVEVSLEEKRAKILFDESAASIEKLRQAVENAGYQVTLSYY